jgi:hypothetical protein
LSMCLAAKPTYGLHFLHVAGRTLIFALVVVVVTPLPIIFHFSHFSMPSSDEFTFLTFWNES